MGLNPARPDLIGRLRRSREEMRQQRIRPTGRDDSRTFIIGADIEVGLLIPAYRVGINVDGETPEWKRLIGFDADLEGGTATIQWQHNGVDVGAPMSLSTTPASLLLTPPIDLDPLDKLKAVVTASSGAFGLSGAVLVISGI